VQVLEHVEQLLEDVEQLGVGVATRLSDPRVIALITTFRPVAVARASTVVPCVPAPSTRSGSYPVGSEGIDMAAPRIPR
jgi:hypothetical protein